MHKYITCTLFKTFQNSGYKVLNSLQKEVIEIMLAFYILRYIKIIFYILKSFFDVIC